MKSQAIDKNTTVPSPKEMKKNRPVTDPSANAKEVKSNDKSVYGSDPETEADLLGTRWPGPRKDKPGSAEHYPDSQGWAQPGTKPLIIKAGLRVHSKEKGHLAGLGGKLVAKVDHMEGDHYIKLTCNDSPDGKHHWIPLGWVEATDDTTVYLNKTEEEFKRGQLNEFPTSDARQKAV